MRERIKPSLDSIRITFTLGIGAKRLPSDAERQKCHEKEGQEKQGGGGGTSGGRGGREMGEIEIKLYLRRAITYDHR